MDQDRPYGVESVVRVSQDQTEAGRALLFQQAGILGGVNSGMASFLAFIIDGKMEVI